MLVWTFLLHKNLGNIKNMIHYCWLTKHSKKKIFNVCTFLLTLKLIIIKTLCLLQRTHSVVDLWNWWLAMRSKHMRIPLVLNIWWEHKNICYCATSFLIYQWNGFHELFSLLLSTYVFIFMYVYLDSYTKYYIY